MERVYYVLEKLNNHYLLKTASYGFKDEEEVFSATNDIVCSTKHNLLVNEYVKFNNETITEKDDKLLIDGEAICLRNDIDDQERLLYDEEFALSIKAYRDNDEEGIKRWQAYLKSYEDKFMNFKLIQNEYL